MKIFNWVHRRFNNKENPKKNGDIGVDDKQFMVEKENNVFERWRGGILSIGTLGYDPLKDEHEQVYAVSNNDYWYDEAEDEEFEKEQLVVSAAENDETFNTDSEEEVENGEEEEEEEEENPLVFAGYKQEFMDLEMEGRIINRRRRRKREEYFGFEYVMMEKKERTTLADLFSADSEDKEEEVMKKQGSSITYKKGDQILNVKTQNSKCKHGRLSYGKKKLFLEDARPIHKLHQLMRRMLKRKIHPDMGGVNSKVSVVNKCQTNEDASLLSTQDAII